MHRFFFTDTGYIAIGKYIKKIWTKAAALFYCSFLFHWFSYFLIALLHTELYFILHSF